MSSSGTSREHRVMLGLFVLMLVAVAFARAHFASSTGIQISGDGADYEAIAAAAELRGRAPFVYRPAVPLLVGTLFAGHLTLGFALVCAAAMFAALYTAGSLSPDTAAGYGIAAVLFFNYQVLFAAANPARIDIVVLAVQLAFVALALRGKSAHYLALLPLCALLKESLLLSLGALALIAFSRRRELWIAVASSALAFVGLHAVIRTSSTPTAFMPPYDGSVPAATALLQMLRSNLSAAAPLDFFVAWSGLCFIALWLVFGGAQSTRHRLLPLTSAVLLLFPLPLVTDVHRAWFELFTPTVLFLLLPQLTAERRSAVYPALTLALAGSVVPYAMRFIAADHLFLLILQQRWSDGALVGVAASLGLAAAALAAWRKAPPHRTADQEVSSTPATPRRSRSASGRPRRGWR